MAAEGVEEDSVQIIDNKKSEEASWSVTNTRLVIDLYRDNPVLYDKKCKDYGNQVPTKKVFSPILVKFKNMITIEEIKKRWHTLRSSLRRHLKKPEEEVKWLYWDDMQFLRTYLDNVPSSDNNQVAEWSSEETEVLINYYQKNECLWNHHIPEYHQAKHKDLLYDILVKELDEKYDVAAIMKKWKQLLKTFREENAKAAVKPSGSGTKDIYKPTWEFYEQLKFLDVVCDDTDETSDSLEPKPKSRKLSRQQEQNSREERKFELFSEAVRAIKEPAQLPPPKENLVANDEVAAYTNYIRLTMSKFSTRNFRKAKKCIGDILYQIEESEDYDNSIAPALGPVDREYSPTPSSNYSSVSACPASQYPQGTYYNL